MNSPALSGGDPALLRRLNTEAVLGVLRNADPMTLTLIGRAASLSRQTVDAVIAELTDGGWIEEVAPERGIGRPARRYRFRAEAGHVLGIDVGATGLRLVLTDLDGTVIASDQAAVPEGLGGSARLEAVRAGAQEFLARHPGIRLRALCLGIPGILDAHGTVRLSTPLPEWNGLDLAGAASTWFDCPAYAENDANLAALAEHWLGAARHADDFIHVIAGHRTGAGMMLGGRLHRGRGGAAGEIGALAVLGWESSSMTDIREAADSAKLFADAQAGDSEAAGKVDRFARTVAQGIAAMVLTVNPDLVIIGGGLARAGEVMVGPIRAHLDQLCLDAPQVDASALGIEAVALGAARMALDHLNDALFGANVGTAAPAPQTQPARSGRPLNRDAFAPLSRSAATT
ncbi:ROK family transcriptional regulator [Streptomyces sp. TLI_171]|uniref:ROK family transcriptional regulator n=1 Tax=Streptomyces sp. TLI_171 TaxID=1938859 RepID=UPI000C527BFE|nr:ROK family transcriptional regulator [Streptomyces sp. TLI_171]RKE23439.1 putative NBD/HSP70 family sugar kinase [Streptomyces sp. TLI_171]